MSKPSQARVATLTRISRALKALGITHAIVAAEASKTSRRGSVDFTTVSHVLAGRRVSANVVATAKRMIAEAKARKPGAPTANPQPIPEPRTKAG